MIGVVCVCVWLDVGVWFYCKSKKGCRNWDVNSKYNTI